jgi:signal transduction histidine kinase
MPTLRTQLIMIIGAAVFIGVSALLGLAGSQMATMTLNAFASEKQTVAVVASSSLTTNERQHGGRNNGDKSDDKNNQANLTAFAQAVLNANAQSTGTNFTYLDSQRKIIATTQTDQPDLTVADEVTRAEQGVISTAIRGDKLYIAIPLLHDKAVTGVLWAVASLAPVQSELGLRWLTLIAAALGALLIACLAGWWLSQRISRPLTAITNVAAHMANGQLGIRAQLSRTNREIFTLERTFNEMAKQIEGMLERQREFVANASHELRAPLAAIRLHAEAIASGAVTDQDVRQYATEIDGESARLGHLVEDLLNLSQIEGDSFKPPLEPINVIDELKSSAVVYRSRSTAKHQQMQIQIDPNIPDLYIHPSHLRLMIGNLLDNAVKYTPENGHINLSASWQPADGSLILEVRDTGIGIPPQDLSRVSERFFRVDRAHTRGIAGTGLGLSLVTAIARSYSGILVLHSNGMPGEGTQAVLTLKPGVGPTVQ